MDIDKKKLEVLYGDLLKYADYRDQQNVKYFVHCTKLTSKKSITEQGLLLGACSDYPVGAPLSKNLDLKGVWFMISLYEGQMMDHSPYGTQRVKIPVGEVMFSMKSVIENPHEQHEGTEEEAASSEQGALAQEMSKADFGEFDNEEDEDIELPDEVDEDVDTVSELEDVGQKGSKKGKGKARDKKRDRKKRAMERKKETPTVKLPPPEQGMKPKRRFALLFFENSYHYSGGSQYVRLVLIRANDPFVQFCKDNMLEIDLFDNPFFNWNGWKLKTIENDKTSNWRVLVEIFAVGDHYLKSLKKNSNWDECGTHTRASCAPCVGVFHPLRM